MEKGELGMEKGELGMKKRELGIDKMSWNGEGRVGNREESKE
jgi:hypothetical protein